MNTKEDYNPLVSVGVLTYNSSKTVLETLESIKAQTYQNIELIISDDASKDNTVEICKEWVEKNKDRFVRCEILTVPENTGIPANANRRIAASQGEWSKGIAADDTLLPDCIENFINYVKEHPEAEIIFAKANVYHNNFTSENFKNIIGNESKLFCEKFTKPVEQYNALLNGDCFRFATLFAKLKTLSSIKYDERFKDIEDYPMSLRLTKAGIKIDFLDKVVVNYRIGTSISSNINDIRTKIRWFLKIESFKKAYIYPNISFRKKIIHKLRYFIYKLFERVGLLNKSTDSFTYSLLKFLILMTSRNLLTIKTIPKNYKSASKIKK